MQIEYIAIEDVVPYKNNPRKNKKAVAGVAENNGREKIFVIGSN